MNDRIMNLRKELGEKLGPARYEHSLSVSYTSIALAMRYDYPIDKAELAGLLHDCAKRYPVKSLAERCREHNIPLTDDELQAPAVLHANYGTWMAEHKYGITDLEILDAIRWHCTGRPEMAPLDKIVYVADYIEPRRDKAPDLPRIRKLAFMDLDRALYEILKSILGYLEQTGCVIDSMTRKAYDYYHQLYKE